MYTLLSSFFTMNVWFFYIYKSNEYTSIVCKYRKKKTYATDLLKTCYLYFYKKIGLKTN